MFTKQDIINAIQKTAKENGGKPLGTGKFEKETGINLYDCQRYWSTFGEAQREAGFIANTLQVPHKEEFILESLATLIRDIGRFPAKGDFMVRRNIAGSQMKSVFIGDLGVKEKSLKKYMNTQNKKDTMMLVKYVKHTLIKTKAQNKSKKVIAKIKF